MCCSNKINDSAILTFQHFHFMRELVLWNYLSVMNSEFSIPPCHTK